MAEAEARKRKRTVEDTHVVLRLTPTEAQNLYAALAPGVYEYSAVCDDVRWVLSSALSDIENGRIQS